MLSPDSFRTARWVRTLNLLLQAVLFLTLFAGLNYLARNHAWRFDLTRQHKFSLSAETLSYIKNLRFPVEIIVTTADDSENPEVRGLLDEYAYASKDNAGGRITTEYLDVYQNRRRAEELGIDQAGLVVLLSREKRRSLTIDELYEIRDRQRAAFRGEQALTAAILDVANQTRQRVYFLVGHGEQRPEDPDPARGLSLVRDQLKARNFEVEAVDLNISRAVPNDAALLVAVAPQSRYSPVEQEMLRQYLTAKAGRLILMLTPGTNISALGLDELLFDWGVLVYDDVICDIGYENIAENGDLLIRAFVQHPITEPLFQNKFHLAMGLTRTVRPDPGRSLRSGLNVVTLAATSPTAWGERDYRSRQPPQPNRGVDTLPIAGTEPPNRLGVIVASERVGVRDKNVPFSVPGGKLVVFGTGDLITNNRINTASLLVFLNSVNWTVDRDLLLNIPARPVERFQLTLSAAEFERLRYTLLLALPGGTLLLGLLVYWTRRS